MVKRGPRAVLFQPAGREREEWPVSRGATWREGVGEGPARDRDGSEWRCQRRQHTLMTEAGWQIGEGGGAHATQGDGPQAADARAWVSIGGGGPGGQQLGCGREGDGAARGR
jgi:hypothetical protein